MDKLRLTQLVTDFRSALQALVDNRFDFHISISPRFPCACCDDASSLLAAFLNDNGFSGALRIHGEHGGRDGELRTHVWLKLDDVLIDITGSQFENYDQPEILIAESDEFLDTFTINDAPEPADFRARFPRGDDFRSYFGVAYDAALEVMA